MINTKKIYNTLLNDETLTTVVSNIFSAYPTAVETFPCIIFLDDNQRDREFSDNAPNASECSVQIHIFSKKISEYVSTAEVAVLVADIMHGDLWTCEQNGEVPDPDDEIEHRIMRFTKSIYY
ncbi:MAG: DUF3168 domain-containing protein [Clostridia bacterium]|nr:DUF3168 domain-containing protein [Clostridia bacterium]